MAFIPEEIVEVGFQPRRFPALGDAPFAGVARDSNVAQAEAVSVRDQQAHVAQDVPTCHWIAQPLRRRLLLSGNLEGKGKREKPESGDQEFHA